MSFLPLSAELTDQEHSVTRLLVLWHAGDQAAFEQLTPLIYNDLLRLAKSRLRHEFKANTLQPTALVHEAYLRLAGQNHLSAENRIHFYAIAANTMRRVLIEHARRRNAFKRDGGVRVTFHPDLESSARSELDLFVLDDALRKLNQVDPRKSRVVELKFFGGLTAGEIAVVEKVSVATVGRELRTAQAWLRREMSHSRA